MLAIGLVLAAPVAAQTPPQQNRPTTRTPTQDPAHLVTVEGCVMREADFPAQRFDDDDLDDLVLTDTKIIKGAAPAVDSARSRPGNTPAGTSGAAGPTYEIEGIAGATLKLHVGRRVQIDGTFEDLDDDVVDIRGSVIRQVAGECRAQ
jgi:hypothetical protein